MCLIKHRNMKTWMEMEVHISSPDGISLRPQSSYPVGKNLPVPIDQEADESWAGLILWKENFPNRQIEHQPIYK
jgi:hypothetical protein